MRVTQTDVNVRVSNPRAIAEYMEFCDESTRSLAMKVGCSHGTIHNMITGRTRNIPMKRAKRVAKILNAPFSALFLPDMSTVTRDVPPRRAA